MPTEDDFRRSLRVYLTVRHLRSQGFSYAEIGEEFGFTRARAHKIIARGWPQPRGNRNVKRCSIPRCQSRATLRGLCSKHYALKFRRVISEGDSDILRQLSRYKAP